jgi:glycerol-3-phosphate dehydrogenase
MSAWLSTPDPAAQRAAALRDLDLPFDVIVIGGGVNGTGVAWDAALRGLRVLLLEKGDLSSGTSAWSSRLIHGGLKYLERYDFKLARESLREREWLLNAAPHLVKPLRFVLPFYSTNGHGRHKLRAGMIAYDVLSFDKSLDRHIVESREEILKRIPELNADGLQGAALYYDGQVEYAERLSVETALAARDMGATVLTYARVDRLVLDGRRVVGVEFEDLETGQTHSARAGVTVNVAGPWVDHVLAGLGLADTPRMIGGTKGTHYYVDPFPGAPADAMYYEARSDGRPMMIIPWLDGYLIGSTDERFEGDLDTATGDADEAHYILAETNAAIPSANLTPEDIRYSYTGVRPLPYKPDGSVAEITRRHIVHDHAPSVEGLLSVVGGKLTTFRALGDHAVGGVVKKLGRPKSKTPTLRLKLPGGLGYDRPRLVEGLQRSGLSAESAVRLVRIYGSRATGIAALLAERPELGAVVDEPTGALAAEVAFAFREEFAVRLADVVGRRAMTGLHPSLGLTGLEATAEVAQREAGWSDERTAQEIEDYHRYVQRFRPPAAVGART